MGQALRLAAVIAVVAAVLAPALSLAQDAWHTMTGPDRAFTAELPAAPRYTPTELAAKGATYTMHQYQLERGQAAFIVQYVSYPKEVDVSNPRHNLRSGLAASAKGLDGGKWASIEDAKHDDLQAVDAIGAGSGNDIRSYSVARGRDLVTLIYVGPKGTARSPDVQRFIASLKIAP